MSSRYAQALEQQRRFARWLASPEGVRVFFAAGPDQVRLRKYYRAASLTLASADPYFWSPDLCGLLEDASVSMPRWTLRREALPTDFGFCWFSQPLRLPETDVAVAALTWGIWAPGAETVPPVERVTAVCCAYVSDASDGIQPLATFAWDLGTTMDSEVGIASPEGWDAPASVDRAHRRIWQYFAAAFALVEQRILVATREPIDRAATRRLKRAHVRQPPAILVVRLRRAVQDGDDADGDPKAWTCRWIVRGHWRQQYYPSDGSHRPIFILPHIKGDPSKPIRMAAERVFAVVR